jgi:hypothetical protein
MRPIKWKVAITDEGLDIYFERNKRFYGFTRVVKCDAVAQPKKGPSLYYVKPLIPGMGHGVRFDLMNPVHGKAAARANAIALAEIMLNDMQKI